MDTYRGVALGVESAWPMFVYDDKPRAVNKMRSGIVALFGLSLALTGLALLAGMS